MVEEERVPLRHTQAKCLWQRSNCVVFLFKERKQREENNGFLSCFQHSSRLPFFFHFSLLSSVA